jgi:hypothetical protein
MPKSSADINELIDKTVRELQTEYEEEERRGVAAKTREIRVYKDRLYCRLKGVGPYTARKPINYKLSPV